MDWSLGLAPVMIPFSSRVGFTWLLPGWNSRRPDFPLFASKFSFPLFGARLVAMLGVRISSHSLIFDYSLPHRARDEAILIDLISNRI